MNEIKLRQAETDADVAAAKAIFREYEAWLGLDLCFQGFEDELKNLPGKYAPPTGRLYLAADGDEIAGCIALRQIEDGICEMKRLFVHEKFRGRRVGKLLIERVISDATAIGYNRM